MLVSIVTGIVFGVGPALSSGHNPAEALNERSGHSTATRRGQKLRALLVVGQMAVSFMLLIGAGLLIRSFVKLQQVDPGFNPSRLLTMRLSPNFTRYSQGQQLQVLGDKVLARVGDVGGVESAALASNFPFSQAAIANGPNSASFEIEGKPTGELAMLVDVIVTSADYFQTIGQRIVDGRAFTQHDDTNSLRVAIVNQTMARHRWGTENPIGRRITFNQGQTWITIIGVAADAKEYGLARPTGDELYLPVRQSGFGQYLLVRTAADPVSVSSAVRGALRDVDSQLAVDRMATMEALVRDSVASPRLTTILLGIFAALALVISASGIAAVMALSVSQRSGELGIRMALGASRAAILFMVVRHGLVLAVVGTLLGIAGSLALTRVLSALLYATSPTDALTYSATSLLFLSVAVVSCLIPARQVTAIDPLEALRRE
jgi:putative ABC transport system permease protein